MRGRGEAVRSWEMQILSFGAAVSFITVAGAYAFLRERFLTAKRTAPARIERERELDRRLHRAA